MHSVTWFTPCSPETWIMWCHVPREHDATLTKLGNIVHFCTSRDVHWTNHDRVIHRDITMSFVNSRGLILTPDWGIYPGTPTVERQLPTPAFVFCTIWAAVPPIRVCILLSILWGIRQSLTTAWVVTVPCTMQGFSMVHHYWTVVSCLWGTLCVWYRFHFCFNSAWLYFRSVCNTKTSTNSDQCTVKLIK